ncbi:SUMF1/EgtB/PvdO family nonheme iron enzyme [Candidatus Entotheonella palauensis]|uniref:SUMF1/EgtB/PvdO family nonheme iron enzyme n=1 Tax=Candidatus Entotheonella palauensis TaxID=93172 RepID=UPI000B7D9174|nr:SUMF1/EgtB/PvdO family nonheme iron enzyme [Candidatus Entotheonella palauensis]
MSDIFLSYASEDLPRVVPFVQALERRGWSVWWDRTLPPGQRFSQVIEEALDAARCVVVVWSKASVASHWVDVEAAEGARRNILVPVIIDDDIRIPLAFRGLQAAKISHWQGHELDREFAKVVQAITRLLGTASLANGIMAEATEGMESSPRPGQAIEVESTGRLTNSLGIDFVLIPAGEFLMGSSDGFDNERPMHRVRISRPFYLGLCAVTQAQWQAVMGNNPSHFMGDSDRPVEQLSWEDIQAFIRGLQEHEGSVRYRLPTEAEWEYANRAGSATDYSFGSDGRQLDRYAWYADNAGNQTHPVRQREPNAWGLYDMHGNVWEWVQDWYGKYAVEERADPEGPSAGANRVIRGGGWSSEAWYCRSAYRGYWPPSDRRHDLGFRLLRMVE